MTHSGPSDLPVNAWRGETYYDRPQLKCSPFEPAVVGGYIFLAGLSGSAAVLGALAARLDKRQPRQAWRRAALQRRARYLSLLAPTIGSMLLIYDLNTPQRFYNMLRVAKRTSPMSIGTWLLMSFSSFAGLSGFAQIVSDLLPRWRWPFRVMRLARGPTAVTGAGLSTYTASLLSATSTPLWAAAPQSTAVRFASSSMASASAALALTERCPRTRRSLENIALASLVSESVGTLATQRAYEQKGVEEGRSGRWGTVEKIGAEAFGLAVPVALLVASRISRQRGLSTAALLATLAGSALLRTSFLGSGNESAAKPAVGMRLAQPDNLSSRTIG